MQNNAGNQTCYYVETKLPQSIATLAQLLCHNLILELDTCTSFFISANSVVKIQVIKHWTFIETNDLSVRVP